MVRVSSEHGWNRKVCMLKRIHYIIGQGYGVQCGTLDPHTTSDDIEEVTCKKCLKKYEIGILETV